MTGEIERIAAEDAEWPVCAECGEEPSTDVDELCDRCGDMAEMTAARAHLEQHHAKD